MSMAESLRQAKASAKSRGEQSARKADGDLASEFIDQRPQTLTQGRLQALANSSPQANQLKAFGEMVQGSDRSAQTSMKQAALQRDTGSDADLRQNQNTAHRSNSNAMQAHGLIQRKRAVMEGEMPPDGYRRFIDPKKSSGQSYAAYAEGQYGENVARAEKIIGMIQGSLTKRGSGGVVSEGAYSLPNPDQWQVLPARGSPIRGYGVKIEYNHKTLMYGSSQRVSYQSTIKRDPESKKIELIAAANYAPTAEQKSGNDDPHLKMNLNQIWASQIAYFTQLEKDAPKYTMAGEAENQPKLKSIKRSKVENWSSLASYWITSAYASGGGRVTNPGDWLALSGSPNGNALLYLILQNPELGEALDPEEIAADPSSMYDLDIDHDGPNFLFN